MIDYIDPAVGIPLAIVAWLAVIVLELRASRSGR